MLRAPTCLYDDRNRYSECPADIDISPANVHHVCPYVGQPRVSEAFDAYPKPLAPAPALDFKPPSRSIGVEDMRFDNFLATLQKPCAAAAGAVVSVTPWAGLDGSAIKSLMRYTHNNWDKPYPHTALKQPVLRRMADGGDAGMREGDAAVRQGEQKQAGGEQGRGEGAGVEGKERGEDGGFQFRAHCHSAFAAVQNTREVEEFLQQSPHRGRARRDHGLYVDRTRLLAQISLKEAYHDWFHCMGTPGRKMLFWIVEVRVCAPTCISARSHFARQIFLFVGSR